MTKAEEKGSALSYCKNSVPEETLLWTHCVMDHAIKNSTIDEIAAGDTAPAYSFWNIF